MNIYAIIYLITNLINGKQYVGFTKQTLKRRWQGHTYQARKGSNLALHNAIRKHGPENFKIEEIYCSVNIDETLNIKEREYIEKYNTLSPDGYNMSLGGEAVMMGRTHTQEAKDKISKKNSGRKFSQEHRDKIGAFHKNRPKSEETKLKLSKSKCREWIFKLNDKEITISNLKEYCLLNDLSYRCMKNLGQGNYKCHKGYSKIK